MLDLLCSTPAKILGSYTKTCPIPRIRRSYAAACGMLAFIYGDGIIEVCLTSTGRKWAAVRVNSPRPSTLFAGIAWILPFTSKRSRGSVFCNRGICGTSMSFKAVLDLKALESYGLTGILGVKPGIKEDLMKCIKTGEGLFSVTAGLIDSEGHVRKKARIIEVGMRDESLLGAIAEALKSKGITTNGPRKMAKASMIEIKVDKNAKPIIENMLNPDKRLAAMRMLVDNSITRTKLYQHVLRELTWLIERKRKLPKQHCKKCANTVLQEAQALVSAGVEPAEKRGGESNSTPTPPYALNIASLAIYAKVYAAA